MGAAISIHPTIHYISPPSLKRKSLVQFRSKGVGCRGPWKNIRPLGILMTKLLFHHSVPKVPLGKSLPPLPSWGVWLATCGTLWFFAYQVGIGASLPQVRRECVRLLDQPRLVKGIMAAIKREPDHATLTAVCTVCHTLMVQNTLVIPRTR